jgi:hypothetical protein
LLLFSYLLSNNLACSKYCCQNLLQRNKEAKPYRHKVIKYRDIISLVYCKDHANGEAAELQLKAQRRWPRNLTTTKIQLAQA